MGYRQAVRHKTLTLARGSSNLPTPAIKKQLDLLASCFLYKNIHCCCFDNSSSKSIFLCDVKNQIAIIKD